LKQLTVIFFCFWALQFLAQKNVFLNLHPVFSNQPFILLSNYQGNDGATVELEHFNYYVSDVKIIHDGGQELYLDASIWLVTPMQYNLYLGFLEVNQIDSVLFTIGVPKPYNTQAGAMAQDISTYPETHPLSFQSPSMYWGWAFGYMHMIVGGKADSNNDQIPDAYFELHNLGNNNQQAVALPCVQTALGNQIDLNFTCHVDRWLNQMPLSTIGVLHGDTGLNAQILQNVNSQDVFTLAANAQISEITAYDLVQMIQDNQCIDLHTDLPNRMTSLQIVSSSGKEFSKMIPEGDTQKINLDKLPSGMYFLQIELNNMRNLTLRFVKP
jgi:hypothetical protein